MNYFFNFKLIAACFLSFQAWSADISEAEIIKNEGNKEYEKKNFEGAIECYTKSLEIEKTEVCLRNRGMAYVALKKYKEAIEDLLAAWIMSPNNAKTTNWLGKAYLAEGEFEKAIFFFEKTLKNQATPPKEIESLLKKANAGHNYVLGKNFLAKKKFGKAIYFLENSLEIEPGNLEVASSLKKAQAELQKGISEVYEINPKVFENIALGHKKLGVLYTPKGANQEARATLESHWDEKKFVPLNRVELPGEIAKFIGKGTKIATVIVQTIPFYFAQSFKDVCVYDIEPAQIKFHKDILSAMQKGSLKAFIENEKRKFLSFAESNIPLNPFATSFLSLRPDFNGLKKQIESMFNHIYVPLFDKHPENISTTEANIFDAINKEDANNPHDVIFLSTIPSITLKDWPQTYRHILTWLKKGKTVVYSLNMEIVGNPFILNELAFSFEEEAQRSAQIFASSAPMVHLKFTPKAAKK